ncbi:MAG: hypothetical protein ACQESF_01435 [Nanobdellota archaeon]
MFESELVQKIVKLYDSNLLNLMSINEISKKLGKKYPYINKKVSDLIECGILKKTVIGRSYLCSLNLDNEKTVLLLALNEINKQDPDRKIVKDFICNYNLELSINSVVKNQGKLIFILNSLRERKKIERFFEGSLVLDKGEFVDMLIEDHSLFSNHCVVYGYERFFELIIFAREELKKVYSPIKY